MSTRRCRFPAKVRATAWHQSWPAHARPPSCPCPDIHPRRPPIHAAPPVHSFTPHLHPECAVPSTHAPSLPRRIPGMKQMDQELGLWSQTAQVQVPAPPFTSWMILHSYSTSSCIHFLPLKSEDTNSISYVELL